MEYSANYLIWKGWEKKFAQLDAFHRIYFDAQLRKACIPAPKNVLEVGFGEGKFLAYARAKGITVMGTEVNPLLVDAARKAGFTVVDTIEELPDGSIDLVVAFDVLEHIAPQELQEFLILIKRKLKAGGYLLARFPNGDSPFALHNQNADVTHLNFIGDGKAQYYARALHFPLVHLSSPAEPLFCGNFKLFVYRLYSIPIKRLVDFFIRLVFFPQTKVNWTSPNRVAVWKKAG